MENLADGVVKHVSGMEPHLGYVNLRSIVRLLHLILHEFGDVEANGNDSYGCHIHCHSPRGGHRLIHVSETLKNLLVVELVIEK